MLLNAYRKIIIIDIEKQCSLIYIKLKIHKFDEIWYINYNKFCCKLDFKESRLTNSFIIVAE